MGGLGAWAPMGDIDFYPNGGRMQKGCTNLFVGAVSDMIWCKIFFLTTSSFFLSFFLLLQFFYCVYIVLGNLCEADYSANAALSPNAKKEEEEEKKENLESRATAEWHGGESWFFSLFKKENFLWNSAGRMKTFLSEFQKNTNEWGTMSRMKMRLTMWHT